MFLVASCCSHKEIVPTSITENETTEIIQQQIQRDTVLMTVADTSSFVGALNVDSTGKISLIPTRIDSGSTSLKQPEVQIRNNTVYVNCEKEAEELLFEWKEKYIRENKTKTKTQINTVFVEKELSKWQVAQIWFGRIFMLILFFGGVGLILYRFFIKK